MLLYYVYTERCNTLIRLVNETTVITKYANNLNANTSMSYYSYSIDVYVYDNPANYLTISNSGKVSGGWSIKVTNPLNRSITVQYNSKMCFLGDAQKWTGLKDLVSITLGAKTSTTVTIKGNGTATSVVFGYVNGNYRLITYANKLNANGTLNMMTSYV